MDFRGRILAAAALALLAAAGRCEMGEDSLGSGDAGGGVSGAAVAPAPSPATAPAISPAAASAATTPSASPAPSASAGGAVATPSPTPDCGLLRGVAGGGASVPGGSGDGGPATAASLGGPAALCFDAHGVLYIADRGDNEVRSVDPVSGVIRTVAGDGTAGFSGDGGPAVYAELDGPSGVCVGPNGNLYISDTLNNRVRRVDAHGDISTVAGDGMSGYNGDGGTALDAALNGPQGICVAPSGLWYFAEPGNHVVREVDLRGRISTLAGTGTPGDGGDGGPASSAQLEDPVGVACDDLGAVYISDAAAAVVRRVDPYGGITTVAGDGTPGDSGDEGAATQASLERPSGLCLGPDGSLYIADPGAHVLRRVDPQGIITTVAGGGSPGGEGDGGPAVMAALSEPLGVACDSQGNLYFSDEAGNLVQEVLCP